MVQEVILPFVILGLLDMMAVAQIRDRDAAVKPFEDDFELLFVGPFTIYYASAFRFPSELRFYIIWTLT